MKVLVLGGSGHIGNRLIDKLLFAGIETVSASRGNKALVAGVNHLQIDSCDLLAMKQAVKDFDAVINCVAGDAKSIAQGADVLTQAALANNNPQIIHLSTMAVYGRFEGLATEQTPLDSGLGWYAAAKCQAENHIQRYVEQGGRAVILRPGCVSGMGSQLWVGRIGRWLLAGRLGDLGEQGDGWTNLVHVDDVCQAIINSLLAHSDLGKCPIYNLSGADSPRWNQYFVDLALAIQATPVTRIGRPQLLLDAYLAGPPLKLLEKSVAKLHLTGVHLADPLPPALVKFFGQQIQLDGSLAQQQLKLSYTDYQTVFQTGVEWLTNRAIDVT
jgi:nucleoside-diphosphate-sugar epimerase